MNENLYEQIFKDLKNDLSKLLKIKIFIADFNILEGIQRVTPISQEGLKLNYPFEMLISKISYNKIRNLLYSIITSNIFDIDFNNFNYILFSKKTNKEFYHRLGILKSELNDFILKNKYNTSLKNIETSDSSSSLKKIIEPLNIEYLKAFDEEISAKYGFEDILEDIYDFLNKVILEQNFSDEVKNELMNIIKNKITLHKNDGVSASYTLDIEASNRILDAMKEISRYYNKYFNTEIIIENLNTKDGMKNALEKIYEHNKGVF